MKYKSLYLLRKLMDDDDKSTVSQQQYQTPSEESNVMPNNGEGSEGDMKILNYAGSKKLLIKDKLKWLNIDLSDVLTQDSTVSVPANTTATDSEAGLGPTITFNLELVGNKNVKLTWAVTGADSWNIKRADGSKPLSGVTTDIIDSENYSDSGEYTDNTTSAASTYTYRFYASNTSVPEYQDEDIITNSLYTTYTIQYLDPQSGPNEGWASNQLVEAAELEDPSSFTGAVNQFTKYLNSSNFNNGDILYDNANGTTPFDGTFGNSGAVNFFVFDGSTLDKVFQVSSTGVLSNVMNRKPEPPSITATASSSSVIALQITGDTKTTKQYQVYKKQGSGSYGLHATINPTSKGSLTDTNTVTNYNVTGLPANTPYTFKVRGINDDFNGDYSNEDTESTMQAGTQWANIPNDITLLTDTFSFGDTATSAALQITLNNGSNSNNTTITCPQPTNGDLKVAVATDQDPGLTGTGGNATGFATSKTVGNASTYYLRFKYFQLKQFSNNTTEDINFTHGSATNEDFSVTCTAQ